MFEQFEETPLFGANLVSQLFRADTRTDKIDLGLGVYRDDAGQTPVMAAVKTAEARILDSQASKSYVGLAGDDAFSTLLAELVLGKDAPLDRWARVQTPGGVAALRIAADLIAEANPTATIWMSSPSWANHGPILRASRLAVAEFRYYDPVTQGVDITGMLEDLGRAKPGDAVLLQACCHNPTGADLSVSEWGAVTEVVQSRGLLPILDVAYQGFAKGLEEDVEGVRAVVKDLPEAMLAVTCSKTFSNYRDRVGILGALARTDVQARRTRQKILALINKTYAMPPDHGATVVKEILSNGELREVWLSELNQMRDRVLLVRNRLAAALRRNTNSDQYDFLERHTGMFSTLSLSSDQVDELRLEHGIYILSSGRMNLAGISMNQIDRVAHALVSVL
ncbi:aspartate/tyrosine/aromatic aminotransferase [Rhodobacteraceae bacterium M385]|nr:aspartate/tyrosine/aromatic aminotransferase [Rhodobacteraceae bacterium M385]